MKQTRRGYTLFEVLLVMTLLVLMAALVVPNLDAMYADYRLAAAVDGVRASWAQGRAHAMDEGRAYRFAIVPGKGNYRVAPDGADYWTGSGPPAPADPANPPLVFEEALPKGITFSTAGASNQYQSGDTALPVGSVESSLWSSTALFLPNGTARDNVEIVFQARGCKPRVLRLRGLTGVVTSRNLAGEGNQR
jgi:prepilin-type N-terminal cleavage/methylation domain-containing protein